VLHLAFFVCCCLIHARLHTNSGYTPASASLDAPDTSNQRNPCVACPEGYYKDLLGSGPCLPCAAERYLNLTGQEVCPDNQDLALCSTATCRFQILAKDLDAAALSSVLLVPPAMSLLDATSLLLSIPSGRQLIGIDTFTGACTLSLRDERSLSTDACATLYQTPVSSATGLVVSQSGHVLFADTGSLVIRYFVPLGGSVDQVDQVLPLTGPGLSAGERVLHGPVSLALSSSEDTLYILDKNRVLNVSLLDSTYPTSVVAGQLAAGFADGIGSRAAFHSPKALVLAHSLGPNTGTIYVADFRAHRVRQIDVATQKVTTLAGYPWKQGMEDGVGSRARFMAPLALALTSDHQRLFVTDYEANTIRVIDVASRAVSTLMSTPPQTVSLVLSSSPGPLQARIDSLFLASQVSKI